MTPPIIHHLSIANLVDGDGSDAVPTASVHSGYAVLGPVRPGRTLGTFEVTVTPSAAGVLRVSIAVDDLGETLSNPCWVSTAPPTWRLYWGDLHSHSDHSFDGVGRFPYEYAREVSRLDFYALTENCERWQDGDWEHLQSLVNKHYRPGEFVTFLAYEATFHDPWGHHNVYFRDVPDGPVLGADKGTVLDLWEALHNQQALTIPHHTGVAFSPKTAGSIPGSTSPAVDWSHHDADLRRNIEIYSGHGQSEFYDPTFDLSYENSDFSTNTSRHGPHYARDAWERGLKLGVIGSSDNHRAQPGRGELGLAAVYAQTLDRGSIFDSLRDRRCYATTGARILVDFSPAIPRTAASTSGDTERSWRLRVSGTAELELVEIFRGVPGRDRSICRRRANLRPMRRSLETTPSLWPRFRASSTPSRGLRAGTFARWISTSPGRIRRCRRVRSCTTSGPGSARHNRGRKPTVWTSPVWLGVDPENEPDPGGSDA